MAPGKAPTKTDSGVNVFNGVYKLTYINMEMAPNIAVFGLMKYKTTKPTNVKTKPKVKALLTDILPDGTGRFFVRSILASKSFSMT